MREIIVNIWILYPIFMRKEVDGNAVVIGICSIFMSCCLKIYFEFNVVCCYDIRDIELFDVLERLLVYTLGEM